MSARRAMPSLVAVLALVAACGGEVSLGTARDAPPGDTPVCAPCRATSECAMGLTCAELDGALLCATRCSPYRACGAGARCESRLTAMGAVVPVCVPTGAACDPAARDCRPPPRACP